MRGTSSGSGMALSRACAVSAFYKTGPYNPYAKAVHAAMSDGKAYAFAFDDVAQQESLLHDAKPRSVTITLPSLG